MRALHLITAAAVVFLAWFTMKFHMDTANDSETRAYVSALLWNIGHATPSTDATGRYADLAPVVLWPFTTAWYLLSNAYEIRGLALALTAMSLVLYALAYLWYRQLGLAWLTSLFGLALLSVSVAFAMLVRGWELDKLVEPGLYLLAALAAWHRRYVIFVVVAALAAVNRETGVFMPLVALAALTQQRGSWRAALKTWPVWVSLAVCLSLVIWLRSQVPPPDVQPFADLSLQRLIYITGGTCLVPLLAVLWHKSAPVGLRYLLYTLAPVWLVFLLATERLEQGALLLTLIGLVWVPITLAGLEQTLRPRPRPRPTPSAPVDAAVPAVPAAR